ncbi:MAG: hypothetical protein WBA93_12125 [Microcoleaceae cyanobacterium]
MVLQLVLAIAPNLQPLTPSQTKTKTLKLYLTSADKVPVKEFD